MISIRRIGLPLHAFAPLEQEATAEGYAFVARTAREWASGQIRFSGPGELFCGAFAAGETLVAIGGLTQDPFLGNPEVGRLRRIYVRAAWRGQGVGTQIVSYLLAAAREHFHAVRLRAENDRAGRLYERFGFRPVVNSDATHELSFRDRLSAPALHA